MTELTKKQLLQCFKDHKQELINNGCYDPKYFPVTIATWAMRLRLENKGIISTCKQIRPLLYEMCKEGLIELDMIRTHRGNNVWRYNHD